MCVVCGCSRPVSCEAALVREEGNVRLCKAEFSVSHSDKADPAEAEQFNHSSDSSVWFTVLFKCI